MALMSVSWEIAVSSFLSCHFFNIVRGSRRYKASHFTGFPCPQFYTPTRADSKHPDPITSPCNNSFKKIPTLSKMKRAQPLIQINPQPSQPPSPHDLDHLRHQARWIRDDLDPQVACNGPDALHSDDILTLDEFLRRLLTSTPSLSSIRFSRLHLAIRSISGQATRWPSKLIERADAVRASWEKEYGSLQDLAIPLYEPGGRLYGVCKPEDLSKELLMIKWLKTPGVKLSPLSARRVGDLGFRPGE